MVGVDAARGVALLAMMAVHLLPEGLPGAVSWSDEVARGRSSAAFAVLAGVAIALASGGRTPPSGRRWVADAAGLLVRCVLIGLLGLLLGQLGSGLAIILTYYAMLFALAAPLLGLPWRPLAGLAIGIAALVPIWSQWVRADLAPLRGASPVLAQLREPSTLLGELALTGYYPALAWSAYLCAGLAVGRLDLSSSRVAVRLLVGGALLAVVAASISSVLVERATGAGDLRPGAVDEIRYGTTPTDSWWWLVLGEPHSGTPFDLATTTGSSLALLGAALLVTPVLGKAIVPLAWTGGMTLTLYCLHVAAVAVRIGPSDPELLYACHVVAVVGIAWAWRSRRPRGPLEQVVSEPSRGVADLVARQRR